MTPAGRKRILLAELDDRLALALLGRLYEHNRTYDVLLSRTADVTHALLSTERFQVVVIHAHPSKPGDIAQLEGELRRVNDTRVVALIDVPVDASAAALYAAGADSVRQLGGPVGELADEIVRVSRADTQLEGRVDQVGMADLIQMFCLCRRSLLIRIAGRERAAVWLHEGEIHHAVSDSSSGQRAMSRIVRADHGRFWAITGASAPMRSIHQDWQHVMLEAAREYDEQVQQATQRQKEAPRSHAPHHSHVRALGKSYRELTELGLQSIKAGDFSKAREYWDAARALGAEAPEVAPAIAAPEAAPPEVAPVTVIKATPQPGQKRERAGRVERR